MATAGPNLPGTGADDASVGTKTWSTPGAITANDNTVAICPGATGAAPQTAVSHYLKGTNFGFAIPAGSVINGIAFNLEKYLRSATGLASGNIVDAEVRVIKGGTVQTAVNRADTTTVYPTGGPTSYPGAGVNYGSTSDLWGVSWAASDINASTFGVALSCTLNKTGGKTAKTINCSVDSMTCTITYTPGAPSVRSPSGGAAYSSPMFY